MFRLTIVILSVLSLVSGDVETQDRVVNGRNGNIIENPYLVSIQEANRHFCGGSILNEKWVLTAAHCLRDIILSGKVPSLTVRAGSTNSNAGGVVKSVERAICHEKYNPQNMNYDVALMKIMGQFPLSVNIKPVELLASPIPSGKIVKLSGWGQMSDDNPNLPKNLQTTEMAYLNTNDCIRMHGRAISETMVCAIAPGKDACRGDSGGPLTLANENILVGVVSWGINCAKAGLPGVYADPSHREIRGFIQKHVGKFI